METEGAYMEELKMEITKLIQTVNDHEKLQLIYRFIKRLID